MNKQSNIRLFWWSSIIFERKSKENFGDILSKYLVEKISGKAVVWKNPKKNNWLPFQKNIYTTTGSILKHVSKHCVVWGSGIISKTDKVEEAKFLAVRGPETYNYLLDFGYKVNKVFGDPAIVLKDIYTPNKEVKYELGIIPHYVDYKKVADWYADLPSIKVIDLLNDDVEAVIDTIYSCKQIVSSSLHGVIVAHTYEIPAVWVKFSDKLSGDNIKFVDYFKSVNLNPYDAIYIDDKQEINKFEDIIKTHPNLPKKGTIKELSKKLMEVCPFKV